MKKTMAATFLSTVVLFSSSAWAQDIELNAEAWNALSEDDQATIEQLLKGVAPGILLPEGAGIVRPKQLPLHKKSPRSILGLSMWKVPKALLKPLRRRPYRNRKLWLS